MFPSVHEANVFLFSAKKEINVSIFYVNVNVWTINTGTELILSLSDPISDASNLMYYFRLQKKVTTIILNDQATETLLICLLCRQKFSPLLLSHTYKPAIEPS